MEQIDPLTLLWPCNYTVKGIYDDNYGKGIGEDGLKIIMEMKYAGVKTWEAIATNQSNFDFAFWLKDHQNLMYEVANYGVYRLPEPRLDFYKYKSFAEVKEHVLQNLGEL